MALARLLAMAALVCNRLSLGLPFIMLVAVADQPIAAAQLALAG